MNDPADTMKRKPWREPMVWLMAGIPLATLLAGLLTLRIAGAGHALDAAPDAVQRRAQAQTTDLSADERAAGLRLEAALAIDADGRIRLRSPSIDALPASLRPQDSQPLRLLLVHPIDAGRDLPLSLQRDAGAWRSLRSVDRHVAWGLRLGDAGRQWRLVGKLRVGESRAQLLPALDAP